MRLLRLYLETTVFNYFFDTEREGHDDVVKLFEAIRAGQYEGYASRYVTDELELAPEPKRSNMLALIGQYGVTILEPTPNVVYMARLYISNGIVSASYYYDSAHIAFAAVHELDIVISYNFKHINREKARIQTSAINHDEGYPSVIICTAKEVLYNERSERQNMA